MTTSNGRFEDFVRSGAGEAIAGAFNALLLEGGYEATKVAGIVARAGVARSTFYEHFQNKEDVLRGVIAPFTRAFATAIARTPDVAAISAVLHHVADRRSFALALFSGKSRDVVVRAFADALDRHLRDIEAAGAHFTIARDLVALHLAEGQIGLVDAWLHDGAVNDCQAVARAVVASAAATVAALSHRSPVS
jgi:AcrR family transcriptional regulator